MQGQPTEQSNIVIVAQQLAVKALSLATDAAPHRAPQGELRWPLAHALPAARLLIDQPEIGDRAALNQAAKSLATTLADPANKITDGFGHNRPSYALFAIHLLGSAAKLTQDQDTTDRIRQAATTLLNTPQRDAYQADPRLAVWRRLIARQHGMNEAEDLPLSSTDPAPLIPLGLNDLIDSWTYYELVGLHGLHLCSLLEHDETLAQRTHTAAEYHLGHTQPDYTTYQPWGLAAFASDAQTAVFAEQQLHDVATHLSIEGPGSAVMPALLLADAAATMAGRMSLAWAQP